MSTPLDVGNSVGNDARLLATGKLLIAAGTTNGGVGTTVAELYDPAAGTFALTGPMTTARSSAASTLLPNGKVLYTGGAGTPSLASAELYDPTAGTFAPNAGSMAVGRSLHGQILLPNGKVLVFGGSDGSNTANCPTPSAELYDPVDETFTTTTGAMVVCRSSFSTTLLPTGKVLIAGGSLGASGGFAMLSSAELYDPTTGTFAPTGSMTIPREGHTATLLPTGEVLIAGGGSAPGVVIASAELYDPTTGLFAATGSMATARTGHSAILLPTGEVLIAGGSSPAIPTINSAELYDPAAGTFSSTGSMGTARYSFFSALLPTGRVLAAGGAQQPSGARLSSAELYSATSSGAPATLTLTPPSATNPVDTQHCVTATVKDALDNPTPGITVRFTVTGSVTASGSATTDANGQATFCYTGPPIKGSDTISAYADTDNDSIKDTGEPSGGATKTWEKKVKKGK